MKKNIYSQKCKAIKLRPSREYLPGEDFTAAGERARVWNTVSTPRGPKQDLQHNYDSEGDDWVAAED